MDSQVDRYVSSEPVTHWYDPILNNPVSDFVKDRPILVIGLVAVLYLAYQYRKEGSL